MPSRSILAVLLLLSAAPARAEPAQGRGAPAAFEQRVVAIMNAGGTADVIQARLTRIGTELPLSVDQQVAIDALKTLVRSRGKAKGVSLHEAEAFAARHPSSPAAALLVAEAALSNDQPERSADTLAAAAAQAGPLVQLVSPVMVSRLAAELDGQMDRRRTASVAKALLYAGWGRGSAGLRSYLALAAIRDEMAAGRAGHARSLLPAVKSPVSLHEILIDNRLAALRDEVRQSAGPRLEKAWLGFLTQTRDEWLSRGDALSAAAYAEALKQANRYEVLADSFLMRFMRGYNCPSDLVGRSVGADLADSLARTGRWTRAEDIMRRSGGISPPLYAAMLLERGQFGRAASLFERSLKAADTPKDRGDHKALAWLRAASACAAFRSGRSGSILPGDVPLLDVSSRLFVLLCMDRADDAKAALTAALENEDERADALRWVQPFAEPQSASDFRNEMNRNIRALQRDPMVLAAVGRVGVILDWPLTAAVPSPADLVSAASPVAWQCGDRSDWDALPSSQPETIRLPDSGT